MGVRPFDPTHNKDYANTPNGIKWAGDNPNDTTDRGNRALYKYPCPLGWTRFSLSVPGFDEKCNGWPVCYHGTSSHLTAEILNQGLRAGEALCYCAAGEYAAYFSPCVEYSSHPRYAKPMRLDDGRYLQMILMCRLNPTAIFLRGPETLRARLPIHSEIPNGDMEWLVHPNRVEGGYHYVTWDGVVVCYGLMIRVAPDLGALPSSAWWALGTDWRMYIE